MTDRRLSTLCAARALLRSRPAQLSFNSCIKYLDSWRGVGDIVGGMRRLGYETEFRQFPQGWRVNVRGA